MLLTFNAPIVNHKITRNTGNNFNYTPIINKKTNYSMNKKKVEHN